VVEAKRKDKYSPPRFPKEVDRRMALRKVRSNIDRLFDKSLTDLIRGIRNNKENEARYIASCIDEIKMELRQESTFVKANAIEKLAYLQMMGYDIAWASFNIIEVMASTKYTEKRIGYLAASQCFHEETDVLMLTTNMIRKDLHSACMYDTGVALGALSCFVTTDLARDLANDIVNLLSSSRPYIRKRAVLLLYKIFLKYPDSLRPTFHRLKERLEDQDPGAFSLTTFRTHSSSFQLCRDRKTMRLPEGVCTPHPHSSFRILVILLVCCLKLWS
uniref:Clathrin/coatomer adaptor adaptin-like N-terminal domain-containing protein n=1 Tax=Parascaris univalens TaxID=6257 RepID=A0A914ZQZ1_PARUN